MQYAKYPTKIMNITQNYKGATSHNNAYIGSPKGYQIDENCGSTARGYLYAPFDLIIKRVYGVGSGGTNTIWMESTSKVKCADGTESIVTVMVIHPDDDTLKGFKVGQVFKQGTQMFLEGKDGNATGYHFHIEVSKTKFSGTGWSKNSKGAWVINKGVKVEDIFYIDKSFTTVKSSNGISFKELPKETTTTTTNTVNYYPKSSYKGTSLVDALDKINVNKSFANRLKIAKKNGIVLYVGLSSQNLKLLNLLKAGKLIKP